MSERAGFRVRVDLVIILIYEPADLAGFFVLGKEEFSIRMGKPMAGDGTGFETRRA